LLERRWGIFRREAYFLAEYVDAPDVSVWMREATRSQRQQGAMNIARLLHKLKRLQFAHGDLKATNIKMVGERPVLIDLDSLRDYRYAWMFAKKHARDLRRLLGNWQHDEATLGLMQQSLLAVYGKDPVLEAAGINVKTNEIR
jgi:tRNA A-37 threonylcarbamoyl transferase component Bud32